MQRQCRAEREEIRKTWFFYVFSTRIKQWTSKRVLCSLSRAAVEPEWYRPLNAPSKNSIWKAQLAKMLDVLRDGCNVLVPGSEVFGLLDAKGHKDPMSR